MKILFDQGTPAPLRRSLPGHEVSTAYELGWNELDNGRLLAAAEESFEVLITTDQNLCHQQNLAGRKLAVLVLPTTSWPRVRERIDEIVKAIETLRPGKLAELDWSS